MGGRSARWRRASLHGAANGGARFGMPWAREGATLVSDTVSKEGAAKMQPDRMESLSAAVRPK